EQQMDILNSIKDIFAMDSEARETYLQTQVKKLQSPSLLRAVLKEMNWTDENRPIVEVEPVKATHLVDLRLQHTDAANGAQGANRLATAFISSNRNERINSSMETADMIQEQAAENGKRLQEAELKVQGYQRQHPTADFATGEQSFVANLQKLQLELWAAQFE